MIIWWMTLRGGNQGETDRAGDNPLLFSISGTVAQTRLDIPGPLITQSRSTEGKAEVLSAASGTRNDNTSAHNRMRYQLSQPAPPAA